MSEPEDAVVREIKVDDPLPDNKRAYPPGLMEEAMKQEAMKRVMMVKTSVTVERNEKRGETILRLTDGSTVREVLDGLNVILREDPLAMEGLGESDGLSLYPTLRKRQDEPFRTLFPGMRWIAAWAIKGSNEGWYVHVEAVCQGERAIPEDKAAAWLVAHTLEASLSRIIYLGKSFGGIRAAAHAAAHISEALGEWDW